ncbi:TIGR03086 family protein [Streptomyces sp. HNM0574]|nr:TIGR03086 family protein [Streptomyces sp. HNM0574]
MQLMDAFDTAFDEWDRLVHQVEERHWAAPTPCADWDVRELLNHLISEHLWAPHLLGGATLTEVGDRFDGDLTGTDPVAAWTEAAAGSRSAFHAPRALDGTVYVSSGQIPAALYCWQMTTDLAVHGWDLAHGLGITGHVIDDALATALYERAVPQIEEWQDLGIFDPPVTVPEDASPQDHLVALLGRTP